MVQQGAVSRWLGGDPSVQWLVSLVADWQVTSKADDVCFRLVQNQQRNDEMNVWAEDATVAQSSSTLLSHCGALSSVRSQSGVRDPTAQKDCSCYVRSLLAVSNVEIDFFRFFLLTFSGLSELGNGLRIMFSFPSSWAGSSLSALVPHGYRWGGVA